MDFIRIEIVNFLTLKYLNNFILKIFNNLFNCILTVKGFDLEIFEVIKFINWLWVGQIFKNIRIDNWILFI
jgi:hypothetical protein